MANTFFIQLAPDSNTRPQCYEFSVVAVHPRPLIATAPMLFGGERGGDNAVDSGGQRFESERFGRVSVRDKDWDGVRLHVVTGKGGTGKTTVAAALALALASDGKPVLLMEVEGRQGIAQLFDVPPLPYEERRVAVAPASTAGRAATCAHWPSTRNRR